MFAMTSREQPQIILMTIPTEAGTHCPGHRKAPKALLKHGRLGDKLFSAGYAIYQAYAILNKDFNEAAVNAARRVSSPINNGVRNEENTLMVMRVAHDHLTRLTEYCRSELATKIGDASWAIPDPLRDFMIVLGGDCSITPAVFSGQAYSQGYRAGNEPATRAAEIPRVICSISTSSA